MLLVCLFAIRVYVYAETCVQACIRVYVYACVRVYVRIHTALSETVLRVRDIPFFSGQTKTRQIQHKWIRRHAPSCPGDWRSQGRHVAHPPPPQNPFVKGLGVPPLRTLCGPSGRVFVRVDAAAAAPLYGLHSPTVLRKEAGRRGSLTRCTLRVVLPTHRPTNIGRYRPTSTG